MLYNCNDLINSNAPAIMTETLLLFWSFYANFDFPRVFTGYDIGWKQILPLKVACNFI